MRCRLPPSRLSRRSQTKEVLPCPFASAGDYRRLGSGERNLPEAKARYEPSERAQAPYGAPCL